MEQRPSMDLALQPFGQKSTEHTDFEDNQTYALYWILFTLIKLRPYLKRLLNTVDQTKMNNDFSLAMVPMLTFKNIQEYIERPLDSPDQNMTKNYAYLTRKLAQDLEIKSQQPWNQVASVVSVLCKCLEQNQIRSEREDKCNSSSMITNGLLWLCANTQDLSVLCSDQQSGKNLAINYFLRYACKWLVQPVKWLLEVCGASANLFVDTILLTKELLSNLTIAREAYVTALEMHDLADWSNRRMNVKMRSFQGDRIISVEFCELCRPSQPLEVKFLHTSGSSAEGLTDMVIGEGGTSDVDVMYG
ncbi:uncharacterized protein LOC122379157 [Amphibalanus amphitrite]|uniref:uncharacterized protein LOC122379157 n=1 Tax=Amphibalanus amphitrite TaxID=1232801 RepID=UPI001C90CE95|nr:uncharacterized protein LOC122379157 [Amphibalanus amphitrite]